MALEGTLRDFSLADIFQLIGLQRKTGVLSLRSNEDVVTVSFVDGRLVGADSETKRLEDRLGQVLIRTGVMTPAELETTLHEQMETLERLGRILLRRGSVERDQLRAALRQQVLQIVFRVFRWQDGDYQFSQEASVDYDSELMVPITAESVLMEGARMLDEWPIIERRIPHRGLILTPIQSPSSVEVVSPEDSDEYEELDLGFLGERESRVNPLDNVKVTPTEFTVLRLTDGRSTVDDIVAASPYGEFDTCKALCTLLTRGIIREASRDEIVRARRSVDSTPAIEARRGIPWFLFALLPLLAASQFLAARNPANPLLGGAPGLTREIRISSSRARMTALWGGIHAYFTLMGSFPDTLADLVRSGILPSKSLTDPWGRPYRYVLRDRSLLLAGGGPEGAPSPELIIFQQLLGSEEESIDGPSLVLVEP